MADSLGSGGTLPVLMIALFGLGLARWRLAIIGAPVLAVFEGALRKWAFPEFGQWIYFAKDFLLLGAYVGFFGPRVVQRRALVVSHPANAVLAPLVLLAVVQLANPSLANLQIGLFGIKAYLMYVPLMYLVPAVFGDTQRLEKYSTRFLLLALIPLLLGIVQFWSPADTILNRYASEDELAPRATVFGSLDKPRITGTFSYISGYSTYLTLICLMAVSGVIFARRRSRDWWLYGLIALVIANLLMTGSRGPFIILAASSLLLFALAWSAGGRPMRRILTTACVALPVVGLSVTTLFPEARTAFVERSEQSEDVPDRLAGMATGPLWAVEAAGAIGYGIGSAHQARVMLMSNEIRDTQPPPAEGEWERIILEIGPVGFALVLLARVLVAGQLLRTFRAFRATELAPSLATALLFVLLGIPGNLVFNHTASLFYWFAAGFGLLAAGRPRPPIAHPGPDGAPHRAPATLYAG